jgi:hypothetical protein
VRIVRRKREAKGQRTREVILATTLCEKAIRAKDPGELYLRRWQMELHFEDLKTTLGMDHLDEAGTENRRGLPAGDHVGLWRNDLGGRSADGRVLETVLPGIGF